MATPKEYTHPIIEIKNQDGTTTIFDRQTAKKYLSSQKSDIEAKTYSILPYLNQFKKYPKVTPTMVSYFQETLNNIDSGSRISPIILFGALSELLLKTLVNISGNYLEDVNAVPEFNNKKGQRKIDYTRALIVKVEEKIRASRQLSISENSHFSRFYEIIEPIFTTIRIDRNDLVHPSIELDLSTLPETEVLRLDAKNYLTYYKAILNLTNVISKF